MNFREQWAALSTIVKGLVIGILFGGLLGFVILLHTWLGYRNRPNWDTSAEVVEGGLLIAALVGFPTSMALAALMVVGGVTGWYIFIVLAPLLNGALVGAVFGAAWIGAHRLWGSGAD